MKTKLIELSKYKINSNLHLQLVLFVCLSNRNALMNPQHFDVDKQFLCDF